MFIVQHGATFSANVYASEVLGRKWTAVKSELDYVIGSAFRFMKDWPDDDVAEFVSRCRSQENGAISLERQEGVVLVMSDPNQPIRADLVSHRPNSRPVSLTGRFQGSSTTHAAVLVSFGSNSSSRRIMPVNMHGSPPIASTCLDLTRQHSFSAHRKPRERVESFFACADMNSSHCCESVPNTSQHRSARKILSDRIQRETARVCLPSQRTV